MAQPAAPEETAAPAEAVTPVIVEPIEPPAAARPPEPEPVFPTLPLPSYRQLVRRPKRHDARQLSFF